MTNSMRFSSGRLILADTRYGVEFGVAGCGFIAKCPTDAVDVVQELKVNIWMALKFDGSKVPSGALKVSHRIFRALEVVGSETMRFYLVLAQQDSGGRFDFAWIAFVG